MSDKQSKKLRKENKIVKKQIKPIVDNVIERAIQQPLRIRWRLALKILLGKRVKYFIKSRLIKRKMHWVIYRKYFGVKVTIKAYTIQRSAIIRLEELNK